MGLLTEILLLPLAPARAAGWTINKVIDVAEQEYYDPDRIRGQLVELSRDLDEGRITREEFEREEDELLDLLAESEAWQRGEGGPT